MALIGLRVIAGLVALFLEEYPLGGGGGDAQGARSTLYTMTALFHQRRARRRREVVDSL